MGYDSVTLFLMVRALYWPRRLGVMFAIGVALGLLHFDQGLFASGGLLLAGSLAGLLSILYLQPVVEGSTRMFAITAFPLVCAFWLVGEGFLAAFTDRSVAAIFGVWL